MFVFFGRKRSVTTVRGGRQVVTECPSCGVRAKFHECELEETVNAYAILDLFTEKKSVFRCTNCGDVFELDEEAARTQLGRAERDRETRRQRRDREAEAKKREREKQRAAQTREREKRLAAETIEDQLAALKRKLRSE